MKIDGFHASTTEGKKIFAISLIVALVLASLSAVGVFAASTAKGQNGQSIGISGGQLRELGAAQRWYNNFRTQPGRLANSSDRAKLDQYLSQYAFALRQAATIVRNGGANSNGQINSANEQSNNSNGPNNGSNGNFNSNRSSAQQLATYLSMMRGLRDKIESVAGSANNGNNNNGNNAGNGIPITGGSSSSSGSTSSGTSSTGSTSAATATATTGTSGTGSTSAATPTATPTTGTNSTGSTSTGTNTTASASTSSNTSSNNNQAIGNNNGNQSNSSLARTWGGQFRELMAAARWYNNFRSQPGQSANSANQGQTAQYLDRYTFALRQAFAIVRNGGANSNGQSNSANGQSNSSNGELGQPNRSGQQQLATYLQMMRGLRDKIMGVSDNNGTTVP